MHHLHHMPLWESKTKNSEEKDAVAFGAMLNAFAMGSLWQEAISPLASVFRVELSGSPCWDFAAIMKGLGPSGV